MPVFAPLINCVIDFSIDGVVLTHQPFIVDLEGPEPENAETVRGYVIPAYFRGGHVRVTWGEGSATEAAAQEVRTRLGTLVAHTFAWTDPDGTVQSYDVAVEAYETEWNFRDVGFYGPVEVGAWVRAPSRESD